MIKHNKKNIGIILIAFLLPMLACNVPQSFALPFGRSDSAINFLENKFNATVLPDYYASEYSCTINTGSFYDVYIENNNSQYAKTENSDTKLTLVNSYPTLTYYFEFHAIGILKNVHPDGTFLGDIKYEHLESGDGTAIWEDTFFYGSISYDKLEISTYKGETGEHRTSGEITGIGALSPNGEEIHVCLDGLSLDQFDMVKAQPFDQLRPACISNHYFICTPN